MPAFAALLAAAACGGLPPTHDGAPRAAPPARADSGADAQPPFDVGRVAEGVVVYRTERWHGTGTAAIRISVDSADVGYAEVFNAGGQVQAASILDPRSLALRRAHYVQYSSVPRLWFDISVAVEGDTLRGRARSGMRTEPDDSARLIDDGERFSAAIAPGAPAHSTLRLLIPALPLDAGRRWEFPVFNVMGRRMVRAEVEVIGHDQVVVAGAPVPVDVVAWRVGDAAGRAYVAAGARRWLVRWENPASRTSLQALGPPREQCDDPVCASFPPERVVF